MPESRNNNLPAVQASKSKPKIGLWIGIILGSFVLTYGGTLFWILKYEKPEIAITQEQQGDAVTSKPDTTQPPVETTKQLPAEENITQTTEPSIMETPDPQNLPGNTVLSEDNTDTVEEPTSGGTKDVSVPAPPPVRETESPVVAQQKQPELPPDYKKLAKIYSVMDAKAAAEILSRLNENLVVGILGEMRERTAAELMMSFSRDKAARLSRELSRFNRNG